MTIHTLVTHGSRKTRCGLKVPPFIEVKPTATTWDDGDSIHGACADGCNARAGEPESHPLQRYNVMAERTVKGQPISVRAGFAMANRDGSVSITLDVLPVDGRLRLVPA